MSALPQCTITGILYDGAGQPLPAGFEVSVLRTRKSGVVISDEEIKYLTVTPDISTGVNITIVAPRLSTIRVFSEATSGTINFADNPDLTVPDSATADLEDLIAQTLVPAEGLTVKDEGTALSALVGAVDFRGAGVTVTLVAGVARITIPGGAAGLTASRVMVTDAGGEASASSVTTATLAFLDVGSSIQTQLNAKQASGAYITSLTGDVTASGAGAAAATLATVNSNVGSFGGVTKTLSATVNAKGLVTAISEAAIAIAESQVTGLVSDLSTLTAAAAAALAAASAAANAALSNLASVSINTALLAQTGVDLGSTAKPFRDAYLFGAGTYGSTSIKLTGTPTGARVVTFPDSSTTIAIASQQITWAGPTQARTITFPDAAITVARTDAGQTFTGTQAFAAITCTSLSATSFITNPGAGAGSERFGAAAVASGAGSSVFGSAGTAGSNTFCCVFGDTASATGTVAVSMGHGAVAPAGNVSIGNASTGNAANGVNIGNSSVSNGNVTIGQSASGGSSTNVVIGTTCVASATGSILIGSALIDSGVANTLRIGVFLENVAGVGKFYNGVLGRWGSLQLGVYDAGLSTAPVGLTLGHQTSGTKASITAGMGISLLMNADSTTTADQNCVQITGLFTTPTHASIVSDIIFYTRTGGAALAEAGRFTGAKDFNVIGAILTADPTSGVGPLWKLGARKAATVALDTTQYLEVNVGGTTYKVGIVA